LLPDNPACYKDCGPPLLEASRQVYLVGAHIRFGRENLMTRRSNRPPIVVEVYDLLNLARLATNRSDYAPVLWWFPVEGKHLLAHLFSLPFWGGSLPVLAYVQHDERPSPYLSYTNIEKEEVMMTNSLGTGRYLYCTIVELEELPILFTGAFSQSRRRRPAKSVATKVRDLSSLMRLVSTMNDGSSTPPVWHLDRETSHILGVFAPFLDYYESSALPLFFYVETQARPEIPYIRYLPDKGGEEIGFAPFVSDMKYVYGRIVSVRSLPFEI